MTDTTKRYRLLKDIDSPELKAKAGDIGKLGAANKVWFDNGRYFFCKDTVESTSRKEWFEVLSEPVKENIKIGSFGVIQTHDGNSADYGFYCMGKIPREKFPVIQQAIESALNDTVVEDKAHEFYLKWSKPIQEDFDGKRYKQSEVDAIRADTWYAARKITDKVVGEIDFKDGDRCPFYEKYFNSINDYLSSLNLNSNDTEYKESWVSQQEKVKEEKIKESFQKAYTEQPTNDNAFVLNDEEVKELARRYYGNLKIGALLGENATEINEDIERRVFDFYVGYKTANGEKIPNKVFQPLNYLQSEQSAPEPSALPTKEYEILSFSGKVANYGFTSNPRTEEWVNKQIEEGYPIHSVRRLLPDMEVFSCKDNTNKGVIESFVIITEENRQTAVTAHLDKRENIGKIAVKVSGSLGAAHPNQLLEDLEKLPPTPTQPVVEDKPQSGLWVDINKGTIEEAKMLDKLWKQFKPIVLPLPKQKLNSLKQ